MVKEKLKTYYRSATNDGIVRYGLSLESYHKFKKRVKKICLKPKNREVFSRVSSFNEIGALIQRNVSVGLFDNLRNKNKICAHVSEYVKSEIN